LQKTGAKPHGRNALETHHDQSTSGAHLLPRSKPPSNAHSLDQPNHSDKVGPSQSKESVPETPPNAPISGQGREADLPPPIIQTAKKPAPDINSPSNAFSLGSFIDSLYSVSPLLNFISKPTNPITSSTPAQLSPKQTYQSSGSNSFGLSDSATLPPTPQSAPPSTLGYALNTPFKSVLSAAPNTTLYTPTPLYLPPSKFSLPQNYSYPITMGERNTSGDNAVLDMAYAFKRGDRKRLSATLPFTTGHPLEPWAAYWELRARLDEANYSEVRDFLKRYAGTYVEDRMRNDWLLMVGSRREWDTLVDEYPYYRMRDDKELQCYYFLAQFVKQGNKAEPEAVDQVLGNWHALRDIDDGCMLAVDRLFDARKISELDIWRKIRVATEFNQERLAKGALKIIEPRYLPEIDSIFKNPARYLSQINNVIGRSKEELITTALIRLCTLDTSEALHLLQSRFAGSLNNEQRSWVWAIAGREAALRNDPRALDYFEHANADKEIGNDELLAWKVRVALRMDKQPKWDMAEGAILAMSTSSQRDPTWIYWRARALLNKRPSSLQAAQDAQKEAFNLLRSIASTRGFYEQLALEETGQKIMLPARPEPLKPLEISIARSSPGLRRALYAINLGLRLEGNREWNYSTNLVDAKGQVGGMNDIELLSAATLACELEVWDRCVNAAERSKIIDTTLRFPTPFKESVLKRAREINIDPAYVYGLIRQESRFVMDAKSTVGASGLMQVMPKTASWTAKKLGMINFTPDQLSSRETNIAIGTGYLKLVLDNFNGSTAMAAAAYNAGPSRVRKWQEGSVVEGAIWVESIAFNETRDYVKKVLANTINYASLLTAEPQSIKAKLGSIAPMDPFKGLGDSGDLP
jgi:soluble lytic murein transglycosylase